MTALGASRENVKINQTLVSGAILRGKEIKVQELVIVAATLVVCENVKINSTLVASLILWCEKVKIDQLIILGATVPLVRVRIVLIAVVAALVVSENVKVNEGVVMLVLRGQEVEVEESSLLAVATVTLVRVRIVLIAVVAALVVRENVEINEGVVVLVLGGQEIEIEESSLLAVTLVVGRATVTIVTALVVGQDVKVNETLVALFILR